jgi:hypothetical protein
MEEETTDEVSPEFKEYLLDFAGLDPETKFYYELSDDEGIEMWIDIGGES